MEENILNFKYMFYKFCNIYLDPSSDVIIAKTGSKNTRFEYLMQKVTKRLKWSQNKTKLIYQIQFVVERAKPVLYGLL